MTHLLDNPVFNALLTGDKDLSFGTDTVKYFDPEVSPFAGFPIQFIPKTPLIPTIPACQAKGMVQTNDSGFEELHQMLPPDRKILFATITPIEEPKGWKQMAYIKGSQFVFDINNPIEQPALEPVPLTHDNAAEMVQLAALTKPGPFDMRTIDFGYYHGIFEDGRLAAMTGQRLHVPPYAEVSAVCTHPDFLGRGYATVLMRHQMLLIREQRFIPFLHVREDNTRAIDVYLRLGFKLRGPMHFYFFKRVDDQCPEPPLGPKTDRGIIPL